METSLGLDKQMIDNYVGKLTASDPGIFGFADLLAGLALMVIAWTLADARYQFRIRVAPLPLRTLTFYGLLFLSLLTLITDLWQANNWPLLIVPGSIITPALWESILGLTLIAIFFAWATYAFISPPVFGRSNSSRFVDEIYSTIIGGARNEKIVVADELRRSVPAIVDAAIENRKVEVKIDVEKLKNIEVDATHLLQILSDKRFCREVVASVPLFALELFQKIGEAKKYRLPVDVFARNIVEEAIRNKDSFLFHEDSFWESGTVGYEKPFSNALFSNYRMVESIGTQFDVGLYDDWDSEQWSAYLRVLLVFLRSYSQDYFHEHSFVLYRGISDIKSCCSDLYKINGESGVAWGHDALRRLDTLLDFIGGSILVLEKHQHFDNINWRIDKYGIQDDTLYDMLARLALDVICSSSSVRSDENLCWTVQHNMVWSKLFKSFKAEGKAGKIFQFKLRRLIYENIIEMESFPNFQGAAILRFSLKVMGIEEGQYGSDSNYRRLHRVILNWTKRNFDDVYQKNKIVAQECLFDGLQYKKNKRKLVQVFPVENLRTKKIKKEIRLD